MEKYSVKTNSLHESKIVDFCLKIICVICRTKINSLKHSHLVFTNKSLNISMAYMNFILFLKYPTLNLKHFLAREARFRNHFFLSSKCLFKILRFFVSFDILHSHSIKSIFLAYPESHKPVLASGFRIFRIS